MSASGKTDNAVEIVNEHGRGGALLLCEHASRHIPDRYGRLGLDPKLLDGHEAWDPGALEVARNLSERLDAPLVRGRLSRLVYDCNRAPDSETAIVERTEAFDVPGNLNLTREQRQERIEAAYLPFRAAVERFTARAPAALVTVHSFTPVFRGVRRDTRIGILHDSDSRLADLLLANAGAARGRRIERNRPYGPEDDVMHSLRTHGMENDLPNVMIEVRNDLIDGEEGVAAIADELMDMIVPALERLDTACRRAS